MDEDYSGGWVLYPPVWDSAAQMPWWASVLETIQPIIWPAFFLLLIACVWAMFARRYVAGAVLVLLSVATAIASAISVLVSDQSFGSQFFDLTGGGDPILYQHVAWFFGYPEIYGALVKCVLLAIGFVWGARALLRRRHHGWLTAFVAASLGLLAWNTIAVQFAHNSFQSGLQPEGWVVHPPFVISNLLVLAVPIVALFHFRQLISKNLVGFLFLISAVLFLLSGALMGWSLWRSGTDMALHDTYYVVAHMRYVFVLTLIFGVFALIYYGFRRPIGVDYSRWLGAAQWLSWTLGTALTFLPQYFIELNGMPRRYVDYTETYSSWEMVTNVGYALWLVSLALLVIVIIEALIRQHRRGGDAAKET